MLYESPRQTGTLRHFWRGCVRERNSKQWTPLDCASSVGAVECAKVLLDYDSPLDPLDRAKSTPLHLVSENFLLFQLIL